NVAEQIAGDDDIERFGLPDEVHGRRIDQQRIGLYVRIVFRNLAKYFVPHDHAVLLSVGLSDGSDSLAAFAAPFKRRPHDSLAAAARENRRLHSNFIRRALVEPAAARS